MVRVIGIIFGLEARPPQPGCHFRTRALSAAEADALWAELRARPDWPHGAGLAGQAGNPWAGWAPPGTPESLLAWLRADSRIVASSVVVLPEDRDAAV